MLKVKKEEGLSEAAEKYFLMDEESVTSFVRRHTSFFSEGEKLKAREIGDGNINYVFKVESESSKKSLVVKQADLLLRSSGRRLSTRRIKIEEAFLKNAACLSPAHIPKVFYSSSRMHAMIMEDISSYKNLRSELAMCKIYPELAEEITSYLCNSLIPTTDLVMPSALKKKAVKRFINPSMCDISESMVFDEPYTDSKKRNVITRGLSRFVQEKLYENRALKGEVSRLRVLFMNSAQSLIHGDLHSASLFVNEEGLKVIDGEFAFFAPMGYDIGNVVAHLVFPLTKHLLFQGKDNFSRYLTSTIEETIDLFKSKALEALKRKRNSPLYTDSFLEGYVEEILHESVGYAGCEIIRRVVGEAKVSELTSVKDAEERRRIDSALIEAALSFIMLRNEVKAGRDVSGMYSEAMKKYGCK